MDRVVSLANNFCSFIFGQNLLSNLVVVHLLSNCLYVNLQATKLFIVTSGTKGGGYHPLRFSVRFKILYRVIQPLIQHCLLRKMVYLNIMLLLLETMNFLLPAFFRN